MMGDAYDDHVNRCAARSAYDDRAREPITVTFIRVIYETHAAYLVLFEEGETVFDESKKKWLPKSECALDEDAKEVIVPEWLAIEKGLI